MKPSYAITILLLAFVCICRGQDYREFTNNDGRSTQAKIVKVEDGKVTIQIPNVSKHYTYPIDYFVEADQSYINKWLTDISVRLELTDNFEVYVGVKKDLNKSGSQYWRYKSENITPTVKFTNKEFEKDFRNVKGVLAIIAVDFTNNRNYAVLDVQEFEFEHLPRKETQEWEGERTTSFWMDDDDAYDDSFGFRYKGYSITLKNHNGEEVYRRATRKIWEKPYDKLKNLKERYSYDENLRNAEGEIPERSSYY
ncbi:hypothetical protein [Rubellicoccus peritrichatus]|uniref:Uncharacterized protein n=1 Tax=Rubellicoccus peritrichatus TaxID=3080537 RepID=A0AAQ3L6Q5_9BACT|nr:hypothetical protein [Puniceicoccus sp. CR14]WOO39687.1 hypothetical protein RZN69_13775 [Puniceicoccus sp. CR14]